MDECKCAVCKNNYNECMCHNCAKFMCCLISCHCADIYDDRINGVGIGGNDNEGDGENDN